MNATVNATFHADGSNTLYHSKMMATAYVKSEVN